MVSPVNAADLGNLGIGVPRATRDEELGQNEFLQLMTTQLKNQDPFKPMESGEFLGQLAQFGTVQGLAGLQASFDSLSTSLVSNQALQAASLVGRSALAEASAVAIGAGQSVQGAVDLPATSGTVTVTVRDAAGQVVRQLDLGSHAEGLANFTWDGMADDGTPAPAGRYTFNSQFQSGNQMEAADTLISAPVDSVLFGADGFSVQLRGIGELPFTAVREIRNDFTSPTVPAAASTTGN
jgi:flagellar basal-body rod modification protein FlgD